MRLMPGVSAVASEEYRQALCGWEDPSWVALREEKWDPVLGRLTRGGRRGEMRCLPQERQMDSARRPGTMIAFDSDKRRDRSTFGQVSPQEICNLKSAARADYRTNVVSNCNAEP